MDDDGRPRPRQLRQLMTLYNGLYPPPRNLVVQGLQATGILDTVRSVLRTRRITHAIVKSQECLSLRHLLLKIHVACIAALHCRDDEGGDDVYGSRTDSVNALGVNLQRLFQDQDEKLVLVLVGIDKQRGLNHNTLSALARLSDVVPNIYLILIVTTPRTLFLQKAGVPYLHFPPYTRAETISAAAPPTSALAPQNHLENCQDLPVLQKWYSTFAATVYDSLFSPTSLSQSHFQRTCQMLWPRFIWPYISGEAPPGRGKNAQWDFPKLLVRQRWLFQNVGEESLVARLLPKKLAMTFDELQSEQERVQKPTAGEAGEKEVHSNQAKSSATAATLELAAPRSQFSASESPTHSLKPPLLSLFQTLVLTAAYLASHTATKLDILLFSRLSSASRSARVKKSYHRRKLFQSPSKQKASSATPTTTTTTAAAAATAGAGRAGGGSFSTPRKMKMAGKSGLEMNLNLPRSFTLERLVAILRAIDPAGASRGRSVVDRVAREATDLERLRLIVSGDGAGARGGGYGARALDDGGEEKRWRVNVPREFVEEMGSRHQSEGGHLGGLIREFELVEG